MANSTPPSGLTPQHVAGVAVGGLIGLAAGSAAAVALAPVLVPLGVFGGAIVALAPGGLGALGAWWGHQATSQ